MTGEGAVFLGGPQGGEEDLGGGAGEGAIVVDHERDGMGVGEERLVAPLAQVLLPQPPLQAVGQGDEVLDHLPAGLVVEAATRLLDLLEQKQIISWNERNRLRSL
jgi:hypothetical protein